MGQPRKRGNTWWIRNYRNGKRYEESSGSTEESATRTLLCQREGDAAKGVPVAPTVGRIRFEEAATDLLNDYRSNGKRTLFAYITGWRVDSEVLTLQWGQVDLRAGEIRLNAGTTKNGEGRVFPLTRDLRTLLEHQYLLKANLERSPAATCPWVFHRSGRPIRRTRGAFRAACIAAGCPGRMIHDLRRTAVRNLVRAYVPERVAIQLTGHKTRSVFERYNIVRGGDLVSAARCLDACRPLDGHVPAAAEDAR